MPLLSSADKALARFIASISPASSSAHCSLRVEALERRDVPATWAVQLLSPGVGDVGTAGATFTGQLELAAGQLADNGALIVTAADQASAIQAALTGSVTASYQGETAPYAFSAATSDVSTASHRAYFLESQPTDGRWRVGLEDLSAPNMQPLGVDWDYDDRTWMVDVREYQAPSIGNGDGLLARYYNAQDFTSLGLIRVDPVVNNQWGNGSPDPLIQTDHFSAQWTGQVQAKYTDSYTFKTFSDDGIRVWVNGQMVVDNMTDHGPMWDGNTPIALTAGQLYTIQVAYYENGGGATAQLFWEGKDYQPLEVIPQTQLYSEPVPSPVIGTGTGLDATYFNNQTLYGSPAFQTIDAGVNHDWQGGSPDAAVNVDHFSARWEGRVQATYSGAFTFYTQSDDGVRLWVNGSLVIDNWTDHGPTEDRSSPVTLTAGQFYDIKMEYFENSGGAVARLLWASDNQVKGVIPSNQLYPTSSLSTTTTSLASSNNPSVQGQNITLTASVASPNGVPTGSVTFFAGTSVLGAASLDAFGVASLAVSTLPPGDHEIVAAFQGSANFSYSESDPLSQKVTIALSSLAQNGVMEGVSTGTRMLSEFTTNSGAEVVNGLTAEVEWGDGVTSTAEIIGFEAAGEYGIIADHLYAQSGNYPANVRLLLNGTVVGDTSVAFDATPFVATDDAYVVYHDRTLYGSVGGVFTPLLANDGIDPASLSITGVTAPAHGTLTHGSDGTFSYAPQAGFLGTDTFSYTAQYLTHSSTAVVTVEVQNTDPYANDDLYAADFLASPTGTTFTTQPDSTANGEVVGSVLWNDLDLEDQLAIVGYTQAQAGTVVLDMTNGSFTYTPGAGFTGEDQFTYTVSDGVVTRTAVVRLQQQVSNSLQANLLQPKESPIQQVLSGLPNPDRARAKESYFLGAVESLLLKENENTGSSKSALLLMPKAGQNPTDLIGLAGSDLHLEKNIAPFAFMEGSKSAVGTTIYFPKVNEKGEWSGTNDKFVIKNGLVEGKFEQKIYNATWVFDVSNDKINTIKMTQGQFEMSYSGTTGEITAKANGKPLDLGGGLKYKFEGTTQVLSLSNRTFTITGVLDADPLKLTLKATNTNALEALNLELKGGNSSLLMDYSVQGGFGVGIKGKDANTSFSLGVKKLGLANATPLLEGKIEYLNFNAIKPDRLFNLQLGGAKFETNGNGFTGILYLRFDY